MIILIFSLVPQLAQAKWNVGISAGHYFLGFGKVNNDLEQNINKKYGIHLRLKGGSILITQIEYALPSGFKIRVEAFTFDSITSDSYTVTGTDYEREVDIRAEATVNPILINGIYSISPGAPVSIYLGLGVGSFFGKFGFITKERYYSDGILTHEEFTSRFEKDVSIGFQILGGIESNLGKNLVLLVETRSIFAVDAKMDHWTRVNWDGFLIGLGTRLRF